MEITGRVPPHNNEAEKMVLGSMILDSDAILDVTDVVKAEDFYRPQNKMIFEVVQDLKSRNEPVDMITVLESMDEQDKMQMIDYLSEITGAGVITTNARHYAKIIKEKVNARQLIAMATKALEMSYSGESSKNVQNALLTSVMEIEQGRDSKGLIHIQKALMDAYEDIEKETSGDKEFIKTGFSDLDNYFSMERGDLVIVAGRPSMGKSAFATSVTKNIAEQGKTSAIFSLEMTNVAVTKRILYSHSCISGNKIKARKADDRDFQSMSKGMAHLSRLPIYLNDDMSLSMHDIERQCRILKQSKAGLDCVMIDYLQIMQMPEGDTKAQQIGKITRWGKKIAKDFDAVVIFVAQLSRRVEQRENKKPIMSDLNESGNIEQDANSIIFLYRDEYYYPDTTDKKGVAEVIVAKQRDGKTGSCELSWIGKYTKFGDVAKY